MLLNTFSFACFQMSTVKHVGCKQANAMREIPEDWGERVIIPLPKKDVAERDDPPVCTRQGIL